MLLVSIMNNEIELIRTIDHSFKDEIIKVFVKERISYLQKSKYVIFLKKCMTGNKELLLGVIYSRDDFDPNDAYPEYSRVEQLIMEIAQDRDLIYNISPREFEEIIERVFQDEGFETTLTQQTRDGGRDIIATKFEMGKPVVFYIECKRYGRQNSVGVSIVRSLYGVQSADRINKAILVTTGHVTRGVRKFVEDQNTLMSVIDIEEIHELIRRSARKI